jgi:putative mRNA 3-end processing factor
MEIRFLGGAREVGKSAILVKGRSQHLLLDYGASPGREEPSFPMPVRPRDIHSLLLTHAHLDHSGGTPMMFLQPGVKLVTTRLSLELSMLLLENFIHLSGPYLPFESLDVLSMSTSAAPINVNDEVKIGDEFTARFPSSGHIPGGTTIILHNDGKKVLYTGDINLIDSQLLYGADLSFGELDAVITESTYSQVDHTPREQTDNEFVNFANAVVERGGTLLVPAFSVGRAQEIACLLCSRNFKHTIAMDGMALKTNEILTRYQEDLRDPKLFRKTLATIEPIIGWNHRRKMVKRPSVIIAPAGMMDGGNVVFYRENVSGNPKNGIAVVSYQAEGSAGRLLLDKGISMIKGKPTQVRAEIRRFDFSGHAGRTELLEMFRHVKGNPKVYAIHGDNGACEKFAKDITDRYGFEATAPQVGDRITI